MSIDQSRTVTLSVAADIPLASIMQAAAAIGCTVSGNDGGLVIRKAPAHEKAAAAKITKKRPDGIHTRPNSAARQIRSALALLVEIPGHLGQFTIDLQRDRSRQARLAHEPRRRIDLARGADGREGGDGGGRNGRCFRRACRRPHPPARHPCRCP